MTSYTPATVKLGDWLTFSPHPEFPWWRARGVPSGTRVRVVAEDDAVFGLQFDLWDPPLLRRLTLCQLQGRAAIASVVTLPLRLDNGAWIAKWDLLSFFKPCARLYPEETETWP